MTQTEKLEAGAAIRKARLEQKLSHFTCAVRAGCSPPTVWVCERGAASDRMLTKVAKALGVELPARTSRAVGE